MRNVMMFLSACLAHLLVLILRILMLRTRFSHLASDTAEAPDNSRHCSGSGPGSGPVSGSSSGSGRGLRRVAGLESGCGSEPGPAPTPDSISVPGPGQLAVCREGRPTGDSTGRTSPGSRVDWLLTGLAAPDTPLPGVATSQGGVAGL